MLTLFQNTLSEDEISMRLDDCDSGV